MKNINLSVLHSLRQIAILNFLSYGQYTPGLVHWYPAQSDFVAMIGTCHCSHIRRGHHTIWAKPIRLEPRIKLKQKHWININELEKDKICCFLFNKRCLDFQFKTKKNEKFKNSDSTKTFDKKHEVKSTRDIKNKTESRPTFLFHAQFDLAFGVDYEWLIRHGVFRIFWCAGQNSSAAGFKLKFSQNTTLHMSSVCNGPLV